MARFPVHVALLLILGCGTINSSVAAALSLEDKLKELESRLETKINLLEAKNVQLEEKVKQLETQLEQNNDDRGELASEVTELKAKVQQQETILSTLLNEKNEPKVPSTGFNASINTYKLSKVSINGLPSSCEDLRTIGHTWSGFYFVLGNTMMESVYCDFTKFPSDAGFQKWIGYADVKSAPVHFYVQRNFPFILTYTPLPFDLAVVNEGNAMNLTSGIFTAPRTGIYFFSFMGMAGFSSSSYYLGIGLHLNGVNIGMGWNEVEFNSTVQNSPVSLQSTLNLQKDDRVWMQIVSASFGAGLYDDSDHWTHFTGFLLEEEIVASL